jgi:malonyl-CoA decarboxylase
MGDTSAVGIQRSAGMMTNYVYRLDDLERNHEAYTREYKITAAYEIESMARQSVARPARR